MSLSLFYLCLKEKQFTPEALLNMLAHGCTMRLGHLQTIHYQGPLFDYVRTYDSMMQGVPTVDAYEHMAGILGNLIRLGQGKVVI